MALRPARMVLVEAGFHGLRKNGNGTFYLHSSYAGVISGA
jgi:hypothetical protein